MNGLQSRRHFLKTGVSLGGGLMISIWSWRCDDHDGSPRNAKPGAPGDEPIALHAYVAIDPDGSIVIRAPCPEIGQGVRTALPMIVAEEMGASWEQVVVEQAPATGAGEAVFGAMAVAGSDSVAEYWEPLREAGATVRTMLSVAAARRWNVSVDACEAREGEIHGPGDRSLAFGELAAEAADLRPEELSAVPVETRNPDSYRLVGSNPDRPDLGAIVRGSAVYGLDVRIPDLRIAVLVRPPVAGSRVAGFDPASALAIEGVEQVVQIEPVEPRGILYAAVTGGVAVIARDTWAALQGAESLDVSWEPTRHGGARSMNEWVAAATRELTVPDPEWLRNEGDAASLLDGPDVVEASYQLPLLAHLCMEPVNYTARVVDDRCDLWGPTQTPLNLQVLAAEALGIPQDAVRVFPTLAGGGFGRRLAFDYGIEAALVARAAGVPVRVVWPREQDIRHDYYRPPSIHRLRGTLDGNGRVTAWEHRLATVSLSRNIRRGDAGPGELYDVQGGADHPYSVPNVRFAWSDTPIALQLGSWRSVSHSFNVFAVESFVDELATAGERDPLALRLELLAAEVDPSAPILLPLPGRRGRPAPDRDLLQDVLRAAAEAADWRPGAPGTVRAGRDDAGVRRGSGIACCYYKASYSATVAEVAVQADGRIRVVRIVTALDCGRVVHPDGLRAQVEGAALDGVATVLHWGTRFEDGRVVQSNFHDYPALRHPEAPEVITRIVASRRPPSGAGEPPYPAVAPAIASAIFDATGVRARRLPVDRVEGGTDRGLE